MPPAFDTTHWSRVLEASGDDPDTARTALEQLCRTYWRPVYAFVRGRGYSPEDAQDLTQEFFSRLIASGGLATADPAKGRFRSFLLASATHFLANDWDRTHAQKRGGGAPVFSLDDPETERWIQEGVNENSTPETLFERRWAETLLESVLLRTREDWNRRDKLERFDLLKGFLTDRRGEVSFTNVAGQLGLSVPALRSLVHKLRALYREIFLEEIAHTVASPKDIGDEIRALFAALGE